MEHLTFLLSGPGDYLAGWLIQPASLADDEAHAFIAVALGIAFWIVLYIVLRLMWAIGRHNSRASKLMRTCHQLGKASFNRTAAWLRRPGNTTASRWRIADVWGVVWRAQTVHLMLYAGLPLLWEAARTAFFIITMPLWIIGPGSGIKATDGTLEHLQQPACWTFVTLCPGPRSNTLSAQLPPACSHKKCPPQPVPPPAATHWGMKALWAALAGVWIFRWRRRGSAASGKLQGAL